MSAKAGAEVMHQCPNCHSRIDDRVSYCPFCNAPVTSVSEQASKAVSVTRMSREQLVAALQTQYRIFAPMQYLYDRVAAESQLTKSRVADKRRSSGCLGALLIFAFLVSGYYVVMSALGFFSGSAYALIPLIVSVAFSILFLVLYSILKKAGQNAISNTKAHFCNAVYELNSYYDSLSGKIIPFEYSCPYTIQGLIYVATNYDVGTVQETINVYDTVRHEQYINWMSEEIACLERAIMRDLIAFAAVQVTRPVQIVKR